MNLDRCGPVPGMLRKRYLGISGGSGMANHAIVASRRDEISRRWLQGESVSAIAAATGLPVGTVKHHLSFVRRSLAAGQPDALRLARGRVLASLELAQSAAWERVGKLQAQAKPDDHAISSYLGVILRGLAQTAKVAGVDGKPADSIRNALIDRAALDWVDAHKPYDPLAEILAHTLGGGGWRAAARAVEAHDRARAAEDADEYDDDDENDASADESGDENDDDDAEYAAFRRRLQQEMADSDTVTERMLAEHARDTDKLLAAVAPTPAEAAELERIIAEGDADTNALLAELSASSDDAVAALLAESAETSARLDQLIADSSAATDALLAESAASCELPESPELAELTELTQAELQALTPREYRAMRAAARGFGPVDPVDDAEPDDITSDPAELQLPDRKQKRPGNGAAVETPDERLRRLVREARRQAGKE
jgi:hypothetical protein